MPASTTGPRLPAGTRRAALDLLFPEADGYADDPARWAHDVLGIHLWSKQVQVAESVRDNPRTAVRSGHGVGKTTVAAVITLWFLDTHTHSRVITTATKWAQVEKLLWHEVRQLHARAKHRPEARGRPIFRRDPLTAGLHLPDGRYAIGLSSKPENSESFAGHHAPNILVVYDEASGIPNAIFEVGEGYMTTDGARALLIGNPTRTGGEFFDAFHSKRGQYNTIHIDAEESPAITGEPVPEAARRALTGKAWVDGRRTAWGEDSPLYQVRVKGQFPKSGTNVVIPLGDVEDAQARELPVPYPATLEQVVVSVDVARFGDDETVIATRHGRRVRIRETYVGNPTTTTRDQAIHWWHVLREESGADPTIVVDDDGVGGGVTDMLREDDFEVVPFNAGGRAIEPDNYPNRRSELWFSMGRRVKELDLDDDDQLAADLTAPTYRFDSDGRRVVESKDDMKKRLGRSPDRGDAALLTLVRRPVIAPPPSGGSSTAVPAGGDWEAPPPTGGSLTGDLLIGDM